MLASVAAIMSSLLAYGLGADAVAPNGDTRVIHLRVEGVESRISRELVRLRLVACRSEFVTTDAAGRV
jgi:hypothetical protein